MPAATHKALELSWAALKPLPAVLVGNSGKRSLCGFWGVRFTAWSIAPD